MESLNARRGCTLNHERGGTRFDFFYYKCGSIFYVSWTPLESADVTMSGVSSALET